MFRINEFKGKMPLGGLRTSFFDVQFINPADAAADIVAPFRIKAASMPERALNPIDISYFGRVIKVAGSATYNDWNVTCYEDEDMKLRNALEAWSHRINAPEQNVRKFGSSALQEYKTDAIVTLYPQTGDPENGGSVLRKYKFIGIFPTSVGNVSLDWENNNVTTFDVTFAYDYWIIDEGGNTGNAGGI